MNLKQDILMLVLRKICMYCSTYTYIHTHNTFILPPSKQRLLSGVHLLEDAGLALGWNWRSESEADVVAGDGIEGRVNVTEGGASEERLLLAVLGNPVVGCFPQL